MSDDKAAPSWGEYDDYMNSDEPWWLKEQLHKTEAENEQLRARLDAANESVDILERRLREMRQERDEARAAAARWRERYEERT